MIGSSGAVKYNGPLDELIGLLLIDESRCELKLPGMQCDGSPTICSL